MIELTKGQELELTTDDGRPLGQIRMGIGWDKARNAGFLATGSRDVDLDATAVQFTGDQVFDFAFYNNLATRDGSVVHQGDNKTGSGEGDDEVITVDLAQVYAKVDTIIFLVSSYQGHTLEWVDNAYCRLEDDHGVEIARITLTLGVPETGLAMAKLTRTGDTWSLHAIGEGIAATVPTESVAALRPFV